VFGDKPQVYFSPLPLPNRARTDWKTQNTKLADDLDRQLTEAEELMPDGAQEARARLGAYLTEPQRQRAHFKKLQLAGLF
jgi:hypothetical protein